ncbi:MAG: hypothetical protein ACRDJ2_10210 [Actinomycetota bacterium]
MRLDPEEMLGCLFRRKVDYVLIGALAATLHGSPVRTNDADICPERTTENLNRLALALRDLDAKVYTVDEPDGTTFACDAQALNRAEIWNLITRHGRLDISFTPSGTEGYRDLRREALRMDIGNGITILVASLLDVIRSKEAAGRAKDRAVLPLLREMLDRFGEHP